MKTSESSLASTERRPLDQPSGFAQCCLACSAQVDVNVPLETAWDLWRDKTQIIKWMPWINKIEVVPDDPKQSKWVLCTDQFGRHWELSWRALDLTPIKHQKVCLAMLPKASFLACSDGLQHGPWPICYPICRYQAFLRLARSKWCNFSCMTVHLLCRSIGGHCQAQQQEA